MNEQEANQDYLESEKSKSTYIGMFLGFAVGGFTGFILVQYFHPIETALLIFSGLLFIGVFWLSKKL